MIENISKFLVAPCALTLLLSAPVFSQGDPSPVATIDSGRLVGTRFGPAQNEAMFLGVPYAAPPTGDHMVKEFESLRELDNQTILRILSRLTDEIREGLPQKDKEAIRSEEAARQAGLNLLATQGADAPTAVIPDEADDGTLARNLLRMLLQDSDIQPKVAALIENPPDDSQRTAALAAESAITLGGLIAWLQTKIEIDIDRKDGKTHFAFKLRKDRGSASMINEIAKQVAKLFVA